MSGIRDTVDSVVDGLQSATHFLSASRAPLDTHGRRPTPPLLERSFEDIKSVAEHGAAFSISDIVGVALPQASLASPRHTWLIPFFASLRMWMP
jgi:hypothetical protein